MPVWLAHLPSVAIPTCIDQPPAFVASHPTGGLPSRPGDYASHESRYGCLRDEAMQTSQKCLPHYQQLSQLRRFQARVAVRVPDLSTSVGSPSRLLAVADAGCFARTSQAGAPTSDGLPTLTARPRCLPQVLYATSSHTALDCLGVPALSLTDDEQSPSWWCPGLTAHSRASRRAQLCCEYGHRESLRESHADCPRNGRPPLFLPNACGTLTVGLALRVSTISIRRRFRRLSPKSA